jgi:hypothetical protein
MIDHPIPIACRKLLNALECNADLESPPRLLNSALIDRATDFAYGVLRADRYQLDGYVVTTYSVGIDPELPQVICHRATCASSPVSSNE